MSISQPSESKGLDSNHVVHVASVRRHRQVIICHAKNALCCLIEAFFCSYGCSFLLRIMPAFLSSSTSDESKVYNPGDSVWEGLFCALVCFFHMDFFFFLKICFLSPVSP